MNRVTRWLGLVAACCALLLGNAGAWAEDGAQHFDIFEYEVEGNTVLPEEPIERAVYPFLGERRTAADVDGARAALEKAYHDAGFLTVSVEVPEQKVDEGLVRLRVVEGRIQRTRVAGAEYSLPSRLKEGTPSMAEGTVPNFNEVQEDLGRLARNPDMRVTPLLRSGRNPGSVEMELAIEDKSPLHGSVELNNKQSADTKTGRIEASVRYDNLWQRRHSIGLSWFVSPRNRDDVEVWALNYSMPVGRDATLAAYAVNSDSDVPTVFGTQSLGRGSTVGLRWVKPLPMRAGLFHSVALGADYKDNKQDTRLFGGVLNLSQPVRYTTLAANWNGSAVDTGSEWRFGAGFTLGMEAFNARSINCNGVVVDQFECRRPGATPSFSVLRLDLQHTRQLLAGVSAFVRFDLQRTGSPLVNTEQFAAGGIDSVRGYLESERVGDMGTRASFELRAPRMALADGRVGLMPLAFYDWASVRIREPLPGQDARALMAGAGIGLRFDVAQAFSGELMWAHALHDGAAGPGRTRDGDDRAILRIKYVF